MHTNFTCPPHLIVWLNTLQIIKCHLVLQPKPLTRDDRLSEVFVLWTLLLSLLFFLVFFKRSTFVASAWSFGFFIPATMANDLRLGRIFYPRFYPLHLFSYLNSWERASIFPFECSVLNKGTTGTIFITTLVWPSPWLRIELGTSCTRSQHYTTRLSRRRFYSCNKHDAAWGWLHPPTLTRFV